MNNKIILITNINSKDEIKLNNFNSNILFFCAEWCKPCRQLYIILENIINNYTIDSKELKIFKIDVDKIELNYNINKLPTLILLDEQEKELKRIEGTNKQNIIEFIETIGKIKLINTNDF